VIIMGNGIIQAASISGSLDAKNIVMDVLTQANAMSGISRLFTVVPVPELVATVPIQKPGAVAEDVEEFETTEISGGEFFHVDFDLKKDRVKMARSDEAVFKSKKGDPLALQKVATAAELAGILDKKVVKALETSPQTGAAAGVWSTVTNSPLIDFATAVAAIRPYKADFCIMPSAVHSKYLGTNAIQSLGTGNPGALEGCVGTVPTFNIPIFVDDNATAKTVTVGSAAGMAAIIGNGPVKVREWDAPNEGATIYQIDVFRQVKAPIFKTDASLNRAVYQITAAIA
jgi:hypothetical protein